MSKILIKVPWNKALDWFIDWLKKKDFFHLFKNLPKLMLLQEEFLLNLQLNRRLCFHVLTLWSDLFTQCVPSYYWPNSTKLITATMKLLCHLYLVATAWIPGDSRFLPLHLFFQTTWYLHGLLTLGKLRYKILYLMRLNAGHHAHYHSSKELQKFQLGPFSCMIVHFVMRQ